jgi:hypothetical protein
VARKALPGGRVQQEVLVAVSGAGTAAKLDGIADDAVFPDSQT